MTKDCLVDEIDHVDVVIYAVQQEVILASRADTVSGKIAAKRIARSLLSRKNSRGQASQERKCALPAKRQLAHLR